MLWIALTGPNQESRTLVAEYLRKYHGFNRKSLHDPVKEIVRKLYWYRRYQYMTWEFRRSIYDALYAVDNTIWVGYLMGRMDKAVRDTVVDDIKYLNEAQFLKEKGFIIVRVTQPRKEIHPSKSLGKTSQPGSLLLHELFNKDYTKSLGVDYSIHHIERYSTFKKIDEMMEQIRGREERRTEEETEESRSVEANLRGR